MLWHITNFIKVKLELNFSILLTKTTAAQTEDALSYYRVRGLYFLAIVFVTTIVTVYLYSVNIYNYIVKNFDSKYLWNIRKCLPKYSIHANLARIGILTLTVSFLLFKFNIMIKQ